MLRFELSMIGAGASVKAAIAETIESRRSGIFVQTDINEFRLVHLDRLVEAAREGKKLLEVATFDPVVGINVDAINTLSDLQIDTMVRGTGGAFGFLGERGGMALLFSISEKKGGPYAAASSGGRCHRPGKLPTTLARDWYHYYAPIPNPNTCTYDGTLIS